jgi:hypothetical protein
VKQDYKDGPVVLGENIYPPAVTENFPKIVVRQGVWDSLSDTPQRREEFAKWQKLDSLFAAMAIPQENVRIYPLKGGHVIVRSREKDAKRWIRAAQDLV